MTQITEILDYDELLRQVDLGNIRIQIHPEFPWLYIANYTEQAAYNREWNDITRICRGLIWDDKSLEVLARPFAKFFNLGEADAPKLDLDTEVMAFRDKADGSLGIMYECPDGDVRLATRGSFASEQAKLGTEILKWGSAKEDYNTWVAELARGWTPLFEIVGPSNRIVLKYVHDHLIPLGYVSMGTGEYRPAL